MVLCCGIPVAALVAANAVGNSNAAETPTEAVSWVIASLDGADEPEDSPLIKYLDDGREQDLLQQLADIRDKLSHAGDYSLDTTDWTTAEDDDGVTVTVNVSLVQTTTDQGRILFNETSAVRWTFHTINDQGLFSLSKGWKVDRIETPGVCETFVNCDG